MTTLHDPPTPTDLLAAVRALLVHSVAPGIEPRLRFEVLVAANALELVARQIEADAADGREHRRILEAFGCVSDRDLSAAIRSGAFDGRWAELTVALQALTARKVAVVNPDYPRAGRADRSEPLRTWPSSDERTP